MVENVEVLSREEFELIREAVNDFAKLTEEDENLKAHLFDQKMVDGDVEVRFFPRPETGPVEDIYFEISVDENADWSEEEKLGAYSGDNLANGGPIYTSLNSELKQAVKEGLRQAEVSVNVESELDFIKEQGESAYSGYIQV